MRKHRASLRSGVHFQRISHESAADLNLDDAGHAYRYRDHSDEGDDRYDEDASAGRYSLHRRLGEALHHVVDDLEWMRA